MHNWLLQIRELYQQIENEYEVYLSVYENDSIDETPDWLDAFLDQEVVYGIPTVWKSERLGTKKYGSVWSVERLRNLANARQACLDQANQKWGLDAFDKIAYIEPDVSYSPKWCKELILARHPKAAGIDEPDIYSGWSLRTANNPKESVFLYDTCATRATPEDITWDIQEQNGKWRGNSVIPTDLGGVDAMCLHRVWSTFNCFCVYKADLFIAGVKWDCVNYRLNVGQGQIGDGWLDADTSVMCETFRAHGYNNVFLNTNCLIRHL